MGRAVCFLASVTVFTSTSVLAQVNSWIIPASGNWDQATNWSLGILPASSQSVMITNSGFKAVAINPSTPVNFPGSMTVSSLTIQDATNSENTLLLNFFGTAVPLTVLNGLTLQNGAQILDFNSGLVVQGGTITVTNSQINQDGGFIITTNATMSLQDAAYNLTNGGFEGGQVSLGNAAFAQFNQYGGTALITNLIFGTSVGGGVNGGGTYNLYGGNLGLPGGLTIFGSDNSVSAYFQAGGTNVTSGVFLEPGEFGISPSFTLNGGLLADNGVTLEADNFGGSAISQNGGTHIITNALDMIGGTETGESANPATYSLNGGTLSAGSISMDASMGTAEFNETNGTASVGEIQGVSAPFDSIFVSVLNLSGGTLTCSNMHMTDGSDIIQSGGALIVSNSLAFDGFLHPGPTLYTTYTLLSGTLFASNISVGGIWIIGDSPTNRITNPGTCTLSNTIVISNAVEQLGRFILASNSTIDLAGSACRLSFANSTSETWAAGEALVISNWNGMLSGGGADQIFFGTSASGLTSQQLSQVQFIDPAGLASGTYAAQILSDGEVVPASGSSGPGLVNSWTNPASGNWDQATNWSLGILPASSQTVVITNSGFKAVAIDSSTPISFPGSMTVSNLTITSPTNGENTLLMNFVGAGSPLRVGSNAPGSLVVGPNAAMVMFSSGLIVNDVLGTNNSRIGGFEDDGTFTQSDNAEVVAGFLDVNGTYSLTNGELFAGNQFINGGFNQQGGTNNGNITVNGGSYDLNDGTVNGGSLVLSNGASFDEFGGFNTNSGMTMTGTTNSLGNPVTSVYTLQEGILETPSITMIGSSFNHYVGTNIVGTLSISNAPGAPGAYVINSGLLAANQIQLIGADFFDNGGTLTGTLNIAMGSASGWFESHAAVQLGQLQLLSGASATVQMLATPCVLRFADSSGVPWASDGVLTIPNWMGSTNGGGSQQLFFGTSASGLTAQQLSQVQFSNPAGLPAGTYSARILSDGEVVPNEVIAASIAFSHQGNNFVLTWPTGWTLQSATNVVGPYNDVTGATSPDTINTTLEPQEFFRLRME